MLTYNEQSWLAWKKRISRMKNVSAAWCHKCPHLGRNAAGCYGEPYCPLFPDFADAAEFSERVAVKLARWDNEYHKGDHLCPYGDDDLDSYIPMCHCINFCQGHPKLGCIAAKLAWARLAVEEEMDAGGIK